MFDLSEFYWRYKCAQMAFWPRGPPLPPSTSGAGGPSLVLEGAFIRPFRKPNEAAPPRHPLECVPARARQPERGVATRIHIEFCRVRITRKKIPRWVSWLLPYPGDLEKLRNPRGGTANLSEHALPTEWHLKCCRAVACPSDFR